ncbi:hypothetical protein Y013_04810 [Rhodococcus pyridinivorans SB3094]|uniref:Uncharacterized protein n=1 Tax=Rhodococcus pyridinivorans SB3094 TaxID=1435356 RepID=V9XMK1_9NOCA|nr:hypothetical protein Y013_04810 [Rhodococcus pyridinivorans SB3094]
MYLILSRSFFKSSEADWPRSAHFDMSWPCAPRLTMVEAIATHSQVACASVSM